MMTPFDPVTGSAVTLRAANRDDARACALDGQTWWPAITRAHLHVGQRGVGGVGLRGVERNWFQLGFCTGTLRQQELSAWVLGGW